MTRAQAVALEEGGEGAQVLLAGLHSRRVDEEDRERPARHRGRSGQAGGCIDTRLLLPGRQRFHQRREALGRAGIEHGGCPRLTQGLERREVRSRAPQGNLHRWRQLASQGLLAHRTGPGEARCVFGAHHHQGLTAQQGLVRARQVLHHQAGLRGLLGVEEEDGAVSALALVGECAGEHERCSLAPQQRVRGGHTLAQAAHQREHSALQQSRGGIRPHGRGLRVVERRVVLHHQLQPPPEDASLRVHLLEGRAQHLLHILPGFTQPPPQRQRRAHREGGGSDAGVG